ncbi:MAG: IS3 family transposase [Pirellulaceae bacterium]
MKYAWIKSHCDMYPVAVVCRVLSVSTSGYYKWRSGTISPRRARTQRIDAAVREVHEQSQGIYGSYKISEEITEVAELESACRNTVAKSMQRMRLRSRIRRSFRPSTTIADKRKKAASNLLAQDFAAGAPNKKWVTDITYLPTTQGFIYLAAVLDLYSRRIVGWSINKDLDTALVMQALSNAVATRRPKANQLLHHSDRGCQYTSDRYQATLRSLGITCSMSRTGCCYDNAVMERFFWSLKHEWTKHHRFKNLEEARASIFKYIEIFYNRQRRHQALGYQTPAEFEEKQACGVAA